MTRRTETHRTVTITLPIGTWERLAHLEGPGKTATFALRAAVRRGLDHLEENGWEHLHHPIFQVPPESRDHSFRLAIKQVRRAEALVKRFQCDGLMSTLGFTISTRRIVRLAALVGLADRTKPIRMRLRLETLFHFKDAKHLQLLLATLPCPESPTRRARFRYPHTYGLAR